MDAMTGQDLINLIHRSGTENAELYAECVCYTREKSIKFDVKGLETDWCENDPPRNILILERIDESGVM